LSTDEELAIEVNEAMIILGVSGYDDDLFSHVSDILYPRLLLEATGDKTKALDAMQIFVEQQAITKGYRIEDIHGCFHALRMCNAEARIIDIRFSETE